jgi:hypothetical protein
MTGIITAIICTMLVVQMGKWAVEKAKEIKKRFKK